MCTLILAWRVLPDAPVVVAANRDEATDRPSAPPSSWGGDPPILAPRDERAGGTWIGVNGAGVVAGISNRWTDRGVAGERSRGLLVGDVLARPTAVAAADATEAAVADHGYEPFNLLVADADRALLIEWAGRLAQTDLEPGVHVVANAGYDDAFRVPPTRAGPARRQAEASRVIRRRLVPDPDETADSWLDRAATILADHDLGVCVHGEGYGTRSASLIQVRADGSSAFRYADGPPCRNDFVAVNGQS